MKIKHTNGVNWDWIDDYAAKTLYVSNKYHGYISLIKVNKVNSKITVDYEKSDKLLFDNGYKGVVFLPDNEKWCVSAVYNTNDEIVEWYFDITLENSIDEQGNPFFIDLYLDVVVSPEYKIAILDQDELKEALDAKIINDSDYDMAYSTCNKLIENIITDKDFLVSFLYKYLAYID